MTLFAHALDLIDQGYRLLMIAAVVVAVPVGALLAMRAKRPVR